MNHLRELGAHQNHTPAAFRSCGLMKPRGNQTAGNPSARSDSVWLSSRKMFRLILKLRSFNFAQSQFLAVSPFGLHSVSIRSVPLASLPFGVPLATSNLTKFAELSQAVCLLSDCLILTERNPSERASCINSAIKRSESELLMCLLDCPINR